MAKPCSIDKDSIEIVVNSCIEYTIRKTERAISSLYDDLISLPEIKSTQFSILAAIKHYGQVSINNLAKGLQVDRTTLSRTIRKLQENGWINIVEKSDKRIKLLELTEKGCQLVATLLPRWNRTHQLMIKGIGGQENWIELKQQIDKLRNIAIAERLKL